MPKLPLLETSQLIPSANPLNGFYMMATFEFNELIDQRLVFHEITSIKLSEHEVFIAQKIKFSIKDFFSKCDQIRSFLRIWSHLLKKSSVEKFIYLCSDLFENCKKNDRN